MYGWFAARFRSTDQMYRRLRNRELALKNIIVYFAFARRPGSRDSLQKKLIHAKICKIRFRCAMRNVRVTDRK